MNFSLGIDLGTTSVKAVLVDLATGTVVDSQSVETRAYRSYTSSVAEQDVATIFAAVEQAVTALPLENRRRIQSIGVCGQMHGCVLWNRAAIGIDSKFESDVTNLITWEDGRCDRTFLDSLPSQSRGGQVSSGYGCATLFWLKRRRSDWLESYERSGTVQDLFVAWLCQLDVPVMSYQNATSWGYFDENQWEVDRLKEAGFPVHLLPSLAEPGAFAGRTAKQWCGIRAGLPVTAALGDLQCHVYSAIQMDSEAAVISIGTSAQLSYIDVECDHLPLSSPVESWPYFNRRHVVVAASLNGGNVLAKFVDMLRDWVSSMGLTAPTRDSMFESFRREGREAARAGSMKVNPRLFGERHCPGGLASITNVGPDDLSMSSVFEAICCGLIRNLESMVSRRQLTSAGIRRIVGCGKALRENAMLQRAVEDCFGLPFVLRAESDAAHGAALISAKSQ